MNYFLNFSLLRRNRNYRLLYMGRPISFLGNMISNVALPYQIYHETHSTLMIGLLSFFQLLPLLFTALLGGVLADRRHRKMLLLVAESFLALGCLLLAWNAFLTVSHVWVIFVVSFFMWAMTGLHRPAFDGIIQQIVKKEDYPAMSSLNTFAGSFCMIVGPAIGGLIIAHFGLVVTFLVDFASFLVSITAILFIHNIPKPKSNADQSTFSALQQGFRYAISRQELLGTYFVDFVAMVFGMPIALFPAIALSFGGVKMLGLLYSAPAVGALVISFVSGWTSHVKRHGVAVAMAAAFWGVAMIGFGFASSIYWALFFLALAGAFDAISGIFRQTMWNETIPTEYRGRLAGIEMISYMSGPKLGDTEAGLVAAAFGITASVVSGGILCVVGVAGCCYFLPRFWQYRSKS